LGFAIRRVVSFYVHVGPGGHHFVDRFNACHRAPLSFDGRHSSLRTESWGSQSTNRSSWCGAQSGERTSRRVTKMTNRQRRWGGTWRLFHEEHCCDITISGRACSVLEICSLCSWPGLTAAKSHRNLKSAMSRARRDGDGAHSLEVREPFSGNQRAETSATGEIADREFESQHVDVSRSQIERREPRAIFATSDRLPEFRSPMDRRWRRCNLLSGNEC
jgi:hypothetical protein